MEASTRPPLNLPSRPSLPSLDKLKQKLLRHGVDPTPKILHNLRKKELQKSDRRLTKQASKMAPPLSDAQLQAISEESHFQTIRSEYNQFIRKCRENEKLVGNPWERTEKLRLRELVSHNTEYDGDRLDPEPLRELSDAIECEMDKFAWLLDGDIEIEERWVENDGRKWVPPKRSEAEAIKLLIDRLSVTDMSVKDWKFTRMMRYSGLQFAEAQMLKIVEGLGNKGHWRHANSVVEWVYKSKDYKHFKSRFVYTKLLKVLGRARKPRETLKVFNWMRRDAHIYPDMAAYHSLAVTLGQAGYIKELVDVVESMKEKPKKISNMKRKNWNPELQPDIIIFNAILNACVQTRQWKGVSWVFQQLRKNGLRPNGASYGLAMEVMLKSGKHDLVHEFFGKMKRNGEALKALTYKVIVRAFWEEGKANDAVQAVRDMEKRGIIGTASVYYELARCLCFYGRWKDALSEYLEGSVHAVLSLNGKNKIKNLKSLRPTKPLAVTFTGMIMSSMDGGHVQDCISLYEHSKTLMAPNIGIINAMLKLYGRKDMFLKAKELFEEIRRGDLHSESGELGHDDSFPKVDLYTFSSMLEASASALQWEYFEYVYKEMTLSGYQYDQRKHSALLVDSSKAGKWYLLEHAFNSLLESGEVPPVSFFTEMTCQAIIRHDYERAVNIVNTMAVAPFQLTLQDWINLFETNRDRIDKASLIELHEKLISHDLINEATVLNLSRALQFIKTPKDNGINEDGIFPANTNNISEGNLVNTGRDNYTSVRRMEEDEDSEENERSCPAELIDYDFVSEISPSDSDDSEFENTDQEEMDSDEDSFNFELIIPSSGVDDSPEADTPSANEILKIWKSE